MIRVICVVALLAIGWSSPEHDPSDVSASGLGVEDVTAVDTDGSGEATTADLWEEACSGACREMTISATVGAQTVTFDRAYYGLTAPGASTSATWELHVEVYRGGVVGCPDQNSSTPDQTLIVTGMEFPEVPLTVTDADGLVVSMLDFAGELTTEPVLAANGEELTWTLWSLCLDCVDGDPNGFLAFDLNAPLPDGGVVAGHGFATHCASMDQRM